MRPTVQQINEVLFTKFSTAILHFIMNSKKYVIVFIHLLSVRLVQSHAVFSLKFNQFENF